MLALEQVSVINDLKRTKEFSNREKASRTTVQWESRVQSSSSRDTLKNISLRSAGTAAPLPRWREYENVDPSDFCQLKLVFGEPLTKTAHPGQAPQQPFAQVILQQGVREGGRKVLVRKPELTSFHQPEESQNDSPYVLPTSQNPPHWNPSWLSNAWATRKDLSQNDSPETTQSLTP